MSTFLELTNKALIRLNEIPLNTSTFDAATGFHAVAKEAVNNSLREINRESHEWPFNELTANVTLVPWQTLYDYPEDAKVIDFDTFTLEYTRGTATNYSVLSHTSYDIYMKNMYVSDQHIIESQSETVPSVVFKKGAQYGVSRVPSNADTLSFTYWGWSNELLTYSDATNVPTRYDDVILFGVLRECYDFRSMNAQSGKYDQMFRDGIKNMRTQLLNDFVCISDTRI